MNPVVLRRDGSTLELFMGDDPMETKIYLTNPKGDTMSWVERGTLSRNFETMCFAGWHANPADTILHLRGMLEGHQESPLG